MSDKRNQWVRRGLGWERGNFIITPNNPNGSVRSPYWNLALKVGKKVLHKGCFRKVGEAKIEANELMAEAAREHAGL